MVVSQRLDVIINLKIILSILALFCFSTAQSIDTLIVADGGPGPYELGTRFIDKASLSIAFCDSSNTPPWTFLQARNALLFSQPLDSASTFTVTYTSSFYGIPKVHSLFTPRYIDIEDSAVMDTIKPFSPSLPEHHGNLTVSGYKSFGVTMGSYGEITLEQGLDIVAGGEIRPGTELTAHLTDQGSSLEGTTREISDFDMIFVTLKNQLFSISVGDQFTRWPMDGIFSGTKKIKGLSVALTPPRANLSAFGSLSGGKHTVQTVPGRSGVQGPYYLSGKGERGIITPVNGTVEVRLNGTDLKEGRDKDFYVDYDLGSITFNPRVLIRDEDLIRIEYEYRIFDYRRSLVGTAGSYYSEQSTLSLKGALWSESDNKNHPLEMVLTKKQIASLREAGDSPALYPVARPVHPKNVAERSSYLPLYKRVPGKTTGDTIFVYSPFNPLEPHNNLNFHEVHFTPTDDPFSGSYELDSSVIRYSEPVYRYVGSGQGNYTPDTPLAPPQREIAGELEFAVNHGSLRAQVNIAGRSMDQNLFSERDNDNNLSSAAVINLAAGDHSREPLSIWLDANYMFRSREFKNELISGWQQRESWDRIHFSDQHYQSQLWESTIGFSPLSIMTIEVGGGQSYRDSLVETEKIQGQTGLYFFDDKLTLSHRGAIFRHHNAHNRFSHQQTITSWLYLDPVNIGLRYRDQWSADTLMAGKGTIAYGLDLRFLPLNAEQNFTFSHLRSAEASTAASDTGHSLEWNQSVNHRIVPGWNVRGESHWHKVVNYEKSTSSTFLISLLSEVYPQGSGFSSRQNYRSNQELGTRFVQIPVYIGKGRGTHSYDTLRREYVPDNLGDYYLREQQMYEGTSMQQIRKSSFEADWHYRPFDDPGVMGDLSWQGVLFMEEHIDAQNREVASRFPGLLTLMPREDKNWHPGLRYADLSYRQDITYRPDSDWNGKIYLLSTLRQLRSYREKGLEPGISAERKLGSFTLGAKAKYLYSTRDDTSSFQSGDFHNAFSLKDGSVELNQIWRPFNDLELFVTQKGGKVNRTPQNPSSALAPDSSFYLQLRPGISWRPHGRGHAQLSYTFSHLPLTAPLDYRIGGGNSSGTSHIFSLFANIQTSTNFNISGVYRGELNRPFGSEQYSSPLHVFSLDARVFF